MLLYEKDISFPLLFATVKSIVNLLLSKYGYIYADVTVIEPYGLIKRVSKVIVDKTKNRLEEVCNNKATVDVILYENSYGELAKSF